MRTCRSRPRQHHVPVVLVIVATLWGCSSAPPKDTAAASPTDRTASEVACELALIKLAGLIEAQSAHKTVSSAVFAEATELYRLSKELYLEREYELALELAEEGIELIEEKR
jgi:hypothetical protein